jgi:diguanylate cyclase (GGDEF)-like protein
LNFTEAKVVAERIRSDSENLSLTVNGEVIKVTVSLGYTSYRHVSHIKEKGPIISMADRALYTAKQAGRNIVFAMRLPGT